jgi:hypothetical protein
MYTVWRRSQSGNLTRLISPGRYATVFQKWHWGRLCYTWVIGSRDGERPWYARAHYETEEEALESVQYNLELSGLVPVEMLAEEVLRWQSEG